MANTTTTIITTGSTVEVTINEPGFHGAWYVATIQNILEQNTPKNKTKKLNNKTSYLVKYHTLLKEDDVFQPLTEVVDSLFVRPLPPGNVCRNNDDNVKVVEVVEGEGDGGGGFEVGDVVDAYHRDGWWIGVVKSVSVDEGGVKKYVVLFENPVEEFEFEGCKLRFHVDWVDFRWMVPPKKVDVD
ncbi:putative Agenet-like domain-containing protein [Helianthus annuus]|nr:putative Agenet-like domain-containing protein [Helianthus annuus]KAJ0625027.1 putative Agenet-like domain-containing protein [Helianthus annuus]KAJ0784998.1 putative Agenet-like domain-containing protein [Helianthus annuus]KAJ0794262.1 putative Agenet-like domain-containing protein [Helianthus annuus]KAJ0958915.1 putative Agenet-like domain-containing protein [Helianthus annuus]